MIEVFINTLIERTYAFLPQVCKGCTGNFPEAMYDNMRATKTSSTAFALAKTNLQVAKKS